MPDDQGNIKGAFYGKLPWKEECYSCSLVGDRAEYTLFTFDDDLRPDQAYLCPTCTTPHL